jgi:hypothetical protein
MSLFLFFQLRESLCNQPDKWLKVLPRKFLSEPILMDRLQPGPILIRTDFRPPDSAPQIYFRYI